jgi:putative chitinase
VKAFERDAGQPQDGIVGPRTSEALNKAEQSLVSNPSHPDNAMYQQAQKALQGVPAGTFANEQERNNAAAALTHEAKVSGMTQIDSVMLNRSGSGLIAVQGGVEDPNSRRVYVDLDQAKTQSVRESSQLIQEAGQPAQNAPNQNQQQNQNQQANPQQVNPQQQQPDAQNREQNREQTEQTRTAPAR